MTLSGTELLIFVEGRKDSASTFNPASLEGEVCVECFHLYDSGELIDLGTGDFICEECHKEES